MRALALVLLLVGCNTYAPWDEPERYYCRCERETDPHWLVLYTCSNEGQGRNEEVALEWCDSNFQSCIDCECQTTEVACD